eukprot:3189485-Alexandrium_andersonii.AAC.1
MFHRLDRAPHLRPGGGALLLRPGRVLIRTCSSCTSGSGCSAPNRARIAVFEAIAHRVAGV